MLEVTEVSKVQLQRLCDASHVQSRPIILQRQHGESRVVCAGRGVVRERGPEIRERPNRAQTCGKERNEAKVPRAALISDKAEHLRREGMRQDDSEMGEAAVKNQKERYKFIGCDEVIGGSKAPSPDQIKDVWRKLSAHNLQSCVEIEIPGPTAPKQLPVEKILRLVTCFEGPKKRKEGEKENSMGREVVAKESVLPRLKPSILRWEGKKTREIRHDSFHEKRERGDREAARTWRKGEHSNAALSMSSCPDAVAKIVGGTRPLPQVEVSQKLRVKQPDSLETSLEAAESLWATGHRGPKARECGLAVNQYVLHDVLSWLARQYTEAVPTQVEPVRTKGRRRRWGAGLLSSSSRRGKGGDQGDGPETRRAGHPGITRNCSASLRRAPTSAISTKLGEGDGKGAKGQHVMKPNPKLTLEPAAEGHHDATIVMRMCSSTFSMFDYFIDTSCVQEATEQFWNAWQEKSPAQHSSSPPNGGDVLSAKKENMSLCMIEEKDLERIAKEMAQNIVEKGHTEEVVEFLFVTDLCSPDFAWVANIKVHPIKEQVTLFLGTAGIIGMKYMRKHGISLDFKHDVIRIDGKPVSTLSAKEEVAVRNDFQRRLSTPAAPKSTMVEPARSIQPTWLGKASVEDVEVEDEVAEKLTGYNQQGPPPIRLEELGEITAENTEQFPEILQEFTRV
ncbi:hypothetical protein B0H16DRAFT_1475972 [Mycena metata]|uniref:Uncharacterized protein n=1 Tax=Mycena metata TaxID=1033252 RepID=A0AAD7HCN8_9AGAR|nr:hypothetical protein B0H16DRAFT_1475972 [Mycena metata]